MKTVLCTLHVEDSEAKKPAETVPRMRAQNTQVLYCE